MKDGYVWLGTGPEHGVSDMDLTTRCPHCSTVFQVGLQDLQLRKGYIRCVQCAHIFDGYAEVVSEPTAPMHSGKPTPGPAPVAVSTRESAPFITPHVFRSSRDGAEPQFTVGSLDNASDSEGRGAAPNQRPGPSTRPSIIIEPHPVRGASLGGSAAPLLRREDIGLLQRLGRWVVGMLVLLGFVLLLGQLTYVYRAQLASTFPSLRPMLVRACVPLRCQVPYARDLTQLAITGSDLKLDATVHDTEIGAVPRHFILHFSLRNRALQPQEWPAIVLDLNDASGVQLVRRNLSPREYLTAQQLAGPFAPDSEVRVWIPITLNDIQINGYQLDLFFP
ncbi:zinc-ribbon and DUF3426 domain-containing protein [Alcaligenaceae bacterium CGII-47]|nr:zinc-ribbon and DUF3426 domain-containing protein [Alcaligenaceae bacterium CGII-47]